MLKRLLLLALTPAIFCSTNAQTTVWSTDVAPILYNSCTGCHRPGGIAPFSLLTFQDAVNHATAMSINVQSKHMPPWPPDPNFKRLAHERLLSQAEIDKITDWVTDGSQQGDPNLAPPLPVFNPNGDLPGTPDLITKIPTYTSSATTDDVYRCFVVPSGMLVDKFITAFEAIPGNRGIVHHVLVYADTSVAHECATLDANDPGPGYTSFGGIGSDKVIMLGGWVPGTAPLQFPNGFGVKMPANSDVVIQIHYPAGTVNHVDSTEIHFFFSPTTGIRNVSIDPVLNHVTSITEPLVIPANTTHTFHEQFQIPSFVNISLLGVAPHMHLIGRNISCYGVTPVGDTQNYIRINNWDFHWQGFYMFKKIQKIGGGTVAMADALYDNTVANPHNPNNPPLNVLAGENTTDEMMIVYFIYTLYQPGDENIVIDSSISTAVTSLNYYRGQQLLDVYPNPSSGQVIVKYHLDEKDIASIDVIDLQGKVVRSLMQHTPVEAGYKAVTFSAGDLPNGLYQVRMSTMSRVMTQKLIVQH